MSNINKDIASVSSMLYATWGADYYNINYPYLSAGLYAVEIRDMGTDIEIGFQTYVKWNKFRDVIYHLHRSARK